MTSKLTNTIKAVALIALAMGSLGSCVACADDTGPLFAQPQDVPSVIDSAPSPQYAAAVERARELVRAAVLEQNLPGVSVAVGAGGTIVWAEGFGWRDVETRTPVTPNTRFNIGTAASAVTAATVAPLGLTNTGADSAAEWSPEHIGEPGEDFPPFTIIRHDIFQPIGLAPAEYPLPGDRATFYVPRSDDNPLRGQAADVHARPGVLRGDDGVLFHGVRSGARWPGERRQHQRRAGGRDGDVADDAAATAASSSPCCPTSRTRTRLRSA